MPGKPGEPLKKRAKVEAGDEGGAPADVFADAKERDRFLATLDGLLDKIHENIDVWGELLDSGATWFFELLTKLHLDKLPDKTADAVLQVLISVFHSLEREQIRSHFLSRVSLPLYLELSPRRKALEVEAFPKLRKPLAKLQKKVAADPNEMSEERHFIPNIVQAFVAALSRKAVNLSCRYLDFFTDLLSQMPTRRFLHAYLEDCNILVICRQSKLGSSYPLFNRILTIFEASLTFPVNNQTAEALTSADSESQHCSRAMAFQRVAHKFFGDKLKDIAMCNISTIEEKLQLANYLKKLSDEELVQLCERLCVLDKRIFDRVPRTRDFLVEALLHRHTKKKDVSDLTAVAVYPDEELLWDTSAIPGDLVSPDVPMALPKLNLQFLTIQDYLLRNFRLMQLESGYEIREDIEEAVERMKPRYFPESGAITFHGKHRMALPLSSLQIIKVAPPPIGFTRPAEVRGELHFSLASLPFSHLRREWDDLKQHDVLILISLGQPEPDETEDIRKRYGIQYVRGCEVIDVRDDEGNIYTGYDRVMLTGQNRHVRVHLDPVTYQRDKNNPNKTGVYDSFSLVLRRRPEENNFKAVLETIRDLMNFPTVVPEWLHDVFLGYGDPDSAHHSNIEVEDELPDADTLVVKRRVDGTEHLFADEIPRQHNITFSPAQAAAILSANRPGLSLIVGPPGTGKTDVAVQIISNLYHSFPNQTTLVITHSNAALNDIFTKVMQKDIDERHLLRLGMGEKDLETEKDFSRWGRVNHVLERRMVLLKKVEKLCTVLAVDVAFAETCESSAHFFTHHVKTRWAKFQASIPKETEAQTARWVVDNFPFSNYFDDTLQPFWGNAGTYENAMKAVASGWKHLLNVFAELEDCKAFELLRLQSDRGNYLLTKQAKVIAMTCTHAALKRRDLLRLHFKYDNLIMEEGAQILEIESFIPMMLQKPIENGESRLKRVVLIGDHHQLPPVVKNQTFQRYCHMDQSMFTRFVRLGVPVIQLNAQGRMRPESADLFRWRYDKLGDLPHIKETPEFKTANGGFTFTHQFIDVEQGQESVPRKHFFQNVIEAEYVVHAYMYMRLLGYPAKKITILTTYNGQKHLIKDVLNHRCGHGTVYGAHPKVSTVDKFQGQQNDFVLLSLVRTEKVGHLRDVRRLVVALSRSRLGLYVFGKLSLFRPVWELKPAIDVLLKTPTTLALNTTEFNCVTTRKAGEAGTQPTMVASYDGLAALVSKMEQVAVTELMKKQAASEPKGPSEAQVRELEERERTFSESRAWQGARPGWYFGTGRYGVGYYLDPVEVEQEQGPPPTTVKPPPLTPEQLAEKKRLKAKEDERRKALNKLKAAQSGKTE